MKRRDFLITAGATSAAVAAVSVGGCSTEAPPVTPANTGNGFLALSSVLTGHSEVELMATGLVDTYQAAVESAVGSTVYERLLAEAGDGSDAALQAVLADPDLGPAARRLIELWFVGAWRPLDDAWHARNGTTAPDREPILSTESYKQGLIWKLLGSHPPGDRQPGYGSWSDKPDS